MKAVVLALLCMFIMAGCERAPIAPSSLVGTFRTRDPVTKGRTPALFWQFEFAADGSSSWFTVEASGRKVGSPPLKERFTLEGKRITFRLFGPADPGLLYDPATLIVVSMDRLRFEHHDAVLLRVKEPNQPLEPTRRTP